MFSGAHLGVLKDNCFLSTIKILNFVNRTFGLPRELFSSLLGAYISQRFLFLKSTHSDRLLSGICIIENQN